MDKNKIVTINDKRYYPDDKNQQFVSVENENEFLSVADLYDLQFRGCY